MRKFPFFNGRLFVSFSQLATFMSLYGGWTTEYDSTRQVKVLYRNEQYPEGLPLHEAFCITIQDMIETAQAQQKKAV